MHPRRTAVIFLVVGALGLLTGAAMLLAAPQGSDDCIGWLCEPGNAGSGLRAMGVAALGIGAVALVMGTLTWFLAPWALSEEPRDPNRPRDP